MCTPLDQASGVHFQAHAQKDGDQPLKYWDLHGFNATLIGDTAMVSSNLLLSEKMTNSRSMYYLKTREEQRLQIHGMFMTRGHRCRHKVWTVLPVVTLESLLRTWLSAKLFHIKCEIMTCDTCTVPRSSECCLQLMDIDII